MDKGTITEGYTSIRGIPTAVLEKFKIKVGFDTDGNEVYHKYSYPHKDKFRYLPKDFSRNSGFSNDRLFGSDLFNPGSSKTVTIVEGELDAAAAFHMLGSRHPVVSLPNASLSTKLIKNEFDYLDSFEQIIVCTDNDDAGRAVADKIAMSFPNKTYFVELSGEKDACDFFMAGKAKDFTGSWGNRQKHTPSGVYNTSKQFKNILENDEVNSYIETPISHLNDLIKGIMTGHLIVLTGEEGRGKTEVMRMLEHTILSEHKGTPIACLHMEESKKTFLLSLLSYVLKVNLRDPDHIVPEDTVNKALDDFLDDENLYLFEMGSEDDPMSLLEKIRYFATVCGCKYVFIDPIQQLSYTRDEGDQNEERTLSKLSTKLEKLATELDIGIVITAHVNDDGQTRSSRMIGKSASVRIDLHRDHMATDNEERNTTKLAVSKNRPLGQTGYAGSLLFDPSSFTLKEKVT